MGRTSAWPQLGRALALLTLAVGLGAGAASPLRAVDMAMAADAADSEPAKVVSPFEAAVAGQMESLVKKTVRGFYKQLGLPVPQDVLVATEVAFVPGTGQQGASPVIARVALNVTLVTDQPAAVVREARQNVMRELAAQGYRFDPDAGAAVKAPLASLTITAQEPETKVGRNGVRQYLTMATLLLVFVAGFLATFYMLVLPLRQRRALRREQPATPGTRSQLTPPGGGLFPHGGLPPVPAGGGAAAWPEVGLPWTGGQGSAGGAGAASAVSAVAGAAAVDSGPGQVAARPAAASKPDGTGPRPAAAANPDTIASQPSAAAAGSASAGLRPAVAAAAADAAPGQTRGPATPVDAAAALRAAAAPLAAPASPSPASTNTPAAASPTLASTPPKSSTGTVDAAAEAGSPLLTLPQTPTKHDPLDDERGFFEDDEFFSAAAAPANTRRHLTTATSERAHGSEPGPEHVSGIDLEALVREPPEVLRQRLDQLPFERVLELLSATDAHTRLAVMDRLQLHAAVRRRLEKELREAGHLLT